MYLVRWAWWSGLRWGEMISLTDLLISLTLCWFPDFPRVTLLISRFPSTDFPISLVPLYWFPDFPLLISRFPSCHFFYWFPSISRFPLTLWSCQNSWFPLISPDFPISPPMWSCQKVALDNSDPPPLVRVDPHLHNTSRTCSRFPLGHAEYCLPDFAVK